MIDVASTRFEATPDPPPELCGLLADSAPANPFCRPEYLGAMRALGYQPWALLVRAQGRPAAGCAAFLRRGALNRTLLVASHPHLDDGDGEAFWGGVAGLCRQRRITYLEVESFAATGGGLPPLPDVLWRRSRSEYVVDLQGAEPWSRYSTNHRRNIRRGRKEAPAVRRAADDRTCAEHLRLIESSLVRRTGRGEDVAAGPRAAELQALARSGAGEFVQVLRGGATLSSVLVLRADRGAYHHSAGTSPEGMACGACHHLLDQVIRDLRAEGKDLFFLGGAETPGLEQFKSGFGARSIRLESAGYLVGRRLRHGLGALLRRRCGLIRLAGGQR